jgi:hypothetical protein
MVIYIFLIVSVWLIILGTEKFSVFVTITKTVVSEVNTYKIGNEKRKRISLYHKCINYLSAMNNKLDTCNLIRARNILIYLMPCLLIRHLATVLTKGLIPQA